MPIEYLILLIAAVPLVVAYLDVWGDPGEDPRHAGIPAPRAPGAGPLRPDARGQGAGDRIAGGADTRPRFRAAPVLRGLDRYAVPEPDTVASLPPEALARCARLEFPDCPARFGGPAMRIDSFGARLA